MDREIQVISLIFQALDRIEYYYPEVRDDILSKLNDLYSNDMVDTYNAFINYTWSDIDNTSSYKIIKEYLEADDANE